jgi:hypothetical protein
MAGSQRADGGVPTLLEMSVHAAGFTPRGPTAGRGAAGAAGAAAHVRAAPPERQPGEAIRWGATDTGETTRPGAVADAGTVDWAPTPEGTTRSMARAARGRNLRSRRSPFGCRPMLARSARTRGENGPFVFNLCFGSRRDISGPAPAVGPPEIRRGSRGRAFRPCRRVGRPAPRRGRSFSVSRFPRRLRGRRGAAHPSGLVHRGRHRLGGDLGLRLEHDPDDEEQNPDDQQDRPD